MKNKVKIEGLDCPNCARSLEGEICKLPSVKDAKIDFLKCELEYEGDKTALSDIIKLTKKLEPAAKIIDKNNENSEKTDKKSQKKLIFDLIMIFIGVIIGVVIYFVKMPMALYWTLYVVAALVLGYKTYYKTVALLLRGKINENLLITISVIGASFVGEHLEGLMVIGLYSIGKIFEGLAVDKSRKSIAALVKTQPEYAVLFNDGEERKVAPEEVKKGDLIIIRPGEKVPVDGIIEEGQTGVDKQSLTGESRPELVKAGQEILSGSIVLDSVIVVRTTNVYKESAINKIMELVENAEKAKSKTETFISKITKWYTLGIIILSLTVFAIVFAVTRNLDSAIYRGLIFLVISCPCAFAISVPLTYFSGLGNASKQGILIKGSNYLDVLSKLKVLCFDKTGTLTTGKFEVTQVNVCDENLKENDLIKLCAIGEQYSIHPIAKVIVEAYKKGLNESDEQNKSELPEAQNVTEIAGKGVRYNYDGKNYFVGRKSENLGHTTVELFEDDKKLGEIILNDKIKESSFECLQELKNCQIKTALLTGDSFAVAKNTAEKLGIDEFKAQILPDEKFEALKKYKSESGKNFVGFVGDGLNDAPSLALADVGISMGISGSPASVEASDVVIVDDDPEKIVKAIKISKATKRIVIENIVLSGLIKVVFLALGSAGITGMVLAVFADVGVTLFAILNALRALTYKPERRGRVRSKI